MASPLPCSVLPSTCWHALCLPQTDACLSPSPPSPQRGLGVDPMPHAVGLGDANNSAHSNVRRPMSGNLTPGPASSKAFFQGPPGASYSRLKGFDLVDPSTYTEPIP